MYMTGINTGGNIAYEQDGKHERLSDAVNQATALTKGIRDDQSTVVIDISFGFQIVGVFYKEGK